MLLLSSKCSSNLTFPSFATSRLAPLEVDAGECEGLDSADFCAEDFGTLGAGPQSLGAGTIGFLEDLLAPSAGKSAEEAVPPTDDFQLPPSSSAV